LRRVTDYIFKVASCQSRSCVAKLSPASWSSRDADLKGAGGPMLVRPAMREYRTWIMDSRRWTSYRPRLDDVVVATYSKCGTTWMQRIVSLLIFQSPEPLPLSKIAPWIEKRFPLAIETVIADFEGQSHRRAMKTHLPFDGLPIFDEVKYIHVARDGRDACLSFHNHGTGLTETTLAELDRAGVADEMIGKPYPRTPEDPSTYFRSWLSESALPGCSDGYQTVSFFDMEGTYWEERNRSNLLLVHYSDLKADLEGETRRIATFLNIKVAEDTWPVLVEAAGFETMKRHGDKLMPIVDIMFKGGKDRFFNKGQSGRWKDIFSSQDLAVYDAKLAAKLPPACIRWLEGGRRASGDPSVSNG
ncbi:MAG: sulfotransferase domain-containing protein, partial [Aestuariivirga sp.]